MRTVSPRLLQGIEPPRSKTERPTKSNLASLRLHRGPKAPFAAPQKQSSSAPMDDVNTR